MATVPSYGVGNVESRPLAPGYQQNLGGDTGALEQGKALERAAVRLDRASDQLGAVAIDAQREDNEREVKRLDVAFSEAIRTVGYGDGTEQNPGYYSLQGEAAVAARQGAMDAIKKQHADLVKDVTNPRVRDLFSRASAVRAEHEFGQIERHTMSQRKVANDATSEARLGAAASDAAAAWNNAEVMAMSKTIAKSEIAGMAARNGWSPEVRKMKELEANSVIVQGAIKGALAANDVETAQKLYDQNINGLTGTVKTNITTMLREQSMDKAAQSLRDQALLLYPNDPEKGLKYVRDNAEGKLEDEALTRVRQQYNDAHTAKERTHTEQERARTEADRKKREEREDIRWSDYLKNRAEHETQLAYTLAERARVEKLRIAKAEGWKTVEAGGSLSQLDPEVKAELDGNTLAAMERRQRQIASGAPVETDWTKYGEYNEMTADQLRAVDLGLARTQLGDAEFARVRDRVTQAQQDRLDPKNEFSVPARVNQAANTLGLVGTEKTKVRGQFTTMVEQELARLKEIKGKPLSDTEVSETITGISDKVAINGRFNNLFGTNEVPLYRVEIPADIRAKMIQEFRADKGRNPTDAQLAREYVARQAQERAQKAKK
jgi:hypothetical protein